MNLGNQLAAYEANGQAEWLRYLNQKVIDNICESEPLMQANLVIRLPVFSPISINSIYRNC